MFLLRPKKKKKRIKCITVGSTNIRDISPVEYCGCRPANITGIHSTAFRFLFIFRLVLLWLSHLMSPGAHKSETIILFSWCYFFLYNLIPSFICTWSSDQLFTNNFSKQEKDKLKMTPQMQMQEKTTLF